MRWQEIHPNKQNRLLTQMNPNNKMYYRNITSLARKTAGALALSCTLSSLAMAGDKPFSKIVTFGDSLSDTGNAYLLTGGFYPAPPNAVGRISDGPLWVEHLADSLNMKLDPEDQYAVAGARTDHGNFNVVFGLTPLQNTGLSSQITAYLQDCGPRGIDPHALHTLWIGPNDLFTTLTFGGDMASTITQAIQNTATAVARLSSHGAKHILVANLPDLGLTPFGGAFSAQLSYITNVYNAGLQQALNSLQAAGIPTIRMDAAGLIREIVRDPGAFNLVDATSQAITSGGNPADYLFWDQVHPTSAGHRAVAERAAEELVRFYSPRHGQGQGHGLLRSLNGLVQASTR
jgi:thermolabile hemolysin